ncbi:hypothetical protein BRADI_2g54392v3 [Brachypodium distachyon]|uniref:Uncharacterized protein n=1 Tax=Brachypodium distachyon TaxID=15368 RepID=A0A2K2DFT6_BRADI|nr:hypothetical protein BRADI_2g54392v3 [Brachypodium distachyon]
MEYWTGDILSDIPNQDNITQFRTKLGFILVDSELNDDNVRNQDDFELDERNIDLDDFRISKPYPISLTLRQIRNILFTDYVDPDCFNVAVRVLASHPSNLCRDQLVYLMDLKFRTMSKFARDAGCREMLDVEQLAQLFRS